MSQSRKMFEPDLLTRLLGTESEDSGVMGGSRSWPSTSSASSKAPMFVATSPRWPPTSGTVQPAPTTTRVSSRSRASRTSIRSTRDVLAVSAAGHGG